MAERTGIAFVAEDFDDEDLTRLTATFSVHLESDDGQDFTPGPEGVSAEEAIAWGRQRADVVQVLLGGEDVPFSAGAMQPDGEPLPEWPAEGVEVRPRPIGSPRDGSRQEIEWLVRSEVQTWRRRGALMDEIRRDLEDAPDVPGPVSVRRTPRGVAATCEVVSPSLAAAVLRLDDLVESAIVRAGVSREDARVSTSSL